MIELSSEMDDTVKFLSQKKNIITLNPEIKSD